MNDKLDRLQAVLEHEKNLVEEFMIVLQSEARILGEPGDDQALADSTAAKNRYADQLAATGEQRQALLAELGYDTGRDGLDHLVSDHPRLQALCSTLLSSAEHASQLNTANGVMIDTFLAHNQQALDALRSLTNLGNLYDATGRSKPAKGQTKNIKAG